MVDLNNGYSNGYSPVRGTKIRFPNGLAGVIACPVEVDVSGDVIFILRTTDHGYECVVDAKGELISAQPYPVPAVGDSDLSTRCQWAVAQRDATAGRVAPAGEARYGLRSRAGN